MIHETIPTQFASSLIENGTFTEGASYWFGQYLRHNRQTSNFRNVPAYTLTIQGGATTDFFEDIPQGANQFVDRPDLYTYPSTRYCRKLLIRPASPELAVVRHLPPNPLISGTGSTVNSAEIRAGDPNGEGIEGYATHPFVYLGPDGTVTPTLGDTAVIQVKNQTISSRVRSVVIDPTTPIEDIPNASLFVESVETSFPSVAGNDTLTDVYIEYGFNPASNTGNLFFNGEGFENVLIFPRGNGTFGLRSGDYVYLADVDATVRITAVATTPEPTFLTASYENIEGLPPITDGGTSLGWRAYGESNCDLIITLPVFQYHFTLGLTCQISGPVAPDDVKMSFRDLSNDGRLKGIGEVVDVIPLVETLIVPLEQDSPGGVVESFAWQRVLHQFYRESVTTIPGRLLVTIPPHTGPTTPESWSVIGDVSLHKFDRTSVQPNQDGAGEGLSPLTSIDPILAHVSTTNSIIPKGAIIMYAGGGTCPAGYKRVDAFNNAPATSRGLGDLYKLPVPDEIVYNSAKDETSLTWETARFNLLDPQGLPIPLNDYRTSVEFSVPNSTFTQSIDLPAYQQKIQPGMSIRERTTDLPSQLLIDLPGFSIVDQQAPYEALDRAHLITDLLFDFGEEASSIPSAKTYPQSIIQGGPPASVYGEGVGEVGYPSTYPANPPNISPINSNVAEFNSQPKVPPAGPPLENQTIRFNSSDEPPVGIGAAAAIGVGAAYWRVKNIRQSGVENPAFQVKHRLPCEPLSGNEITVWGAGTWREGSDSENAINLVSLTDWDVLFVEIWGHVVGTPPTAVATTITDPSVFGTVQGQPGETFVFLDAFVGKVQEETSTSWNIYRYDSLPIKLLGFNNTINWHPTNVPNGGPGREETAIVNAIVKAYPAKLYGAPGAEQVFKDVPLVPGFTSPQGSGEGFSQSIITLNNQKRWITRFVESSLVVNIAGELRNTTNPYLVVEPSGYLRYDDPDTGMDYGAGGHTHQILSGPNANIEIPHLNPNFDHAEDYDPLFIPANHGHDSLDKYVFPLPSALAVTLCQKL